MRRLRAARRVLSLSGSEWGELLHAQCTLVVAQMLVWTRPFGKLIAPEAAMVDAPSRVLAPAQRADLAMAFGVARAVRRAAERGVFRPKCLVRSLAVLRLLERRGARGACIRVGVQRVDGQIHAHAWVECWGRVVSEPPRTVAQFAPLLDVRDARMPHPAGEHARANGSLEWQP